MSENTQTLENTTPVKRGRGRPRKTLQAVLPVNKAIIVKESKDAVKSKQEKLTALLRATNNRYSTLDAKEYQNTLEHMNLTDLQDECMKVGLKPNVTTETRNISIATLMELFHENRRSFIPDESGINQTILSDDKRAKLLELMKAGR